MAAPAVTTRSGSARPAPHAGARALVVSLLAVLLGAAGHAAVGGGIDPLGAAAALVFVLPLAVLASDRERSLPAIAALLALGQAAVHGAGVITDPAAHAGHLHASPGVIICGGHAAAGGSTTGTAAAMLGVHLLVTALCAVLLRRGERALWAAVRRVARRLAGVAPVLSLLPAAVRRAACAACAAPIPAIASGSSRRGPPAPVLIPVPSR